MTEFEKYRENFKKTCILEAVASAVLLLAIIMLIFAPCLSIDLESPNLNPAMLPDSFTEKVLENFERFLETGVLNTSANFSLLDEMIQTAKNLMSEDSALMLLSSMFAIDYLLIIYAFLYCLIGTIVRLCKLSSRNSYALERYDMIKKGIRKDQWSKVVFVVCANFFSAIFMLLGEFFLILRPGDLSKASMFSYFFGFNGFTVLAIFAIILLIAAIALAIYSSVVDKKTRMAILKGFYLTKEDQPKPAE